MRLGWRAVALILSAWASPGTAEGTQNAVPSCYAATRIGVDPAPPARAIFVLVDQTTALGPALISTVRENMRNLLRPGTSFTIATFSAFQRDHFTTLLAAGALEAPVAPQRRSRLSVPRLRRLDACLRRQAAFGGQLAITSFLRAAAANAASFSRSEILASLKQLSARVAAAPARDRIVIIASDMLEHSSATSFYRNRALKVIDPAAEMRRALGQGLLGDFGGARIFVVGAGLLPPDQRTAGRDIRALNALEAFWTAWFRRSGARLVAFGHPDLVVPIQ